MLMEIKSSPYFAKYLRSSDPRAVDSKRLPSALAERLLTMASLWDKTSKKDIKGDYEQMLVPALELLETLCMVFVKEDIDTVVPPAMRQRLEPILSRWVSMGRGTPLGHLSASLSVQFNLDNALLLGKTVESGINEKMVSVKGAYKMGRKMAGGWAECGLPTCDKRSDLKTCARLVLLHP